MLFVMIALAVITLAMMAKGQARRFPEPQEYGEDWHELPSH